MTKLLYVDDYLVMQKEFPLFLERQGYQVTACGNFQQAQRELGRGGYAAIISEVQCNESGRSQSDIVSESADVVCLLRTVAAQNLGIPVVILTANHAFLKPKAYPSNMPQPVRILDKLDAVMDTKKLLQILGQYAPL